MKHITTYKLFEGEVKFYHISLCNNRSSIEKNGLNSSGPTPWPEDNYEKGNYLFDNIEKARKYGFGNGDPFDIWEVDVSKYNVKNDSITKDAFLVSENINPTDIKLIETHDKDVTNPITENERPIISYDFDGCLHVSVEGHDPINFTEPDSWEPFTEMHEQLKSDAKEHKIIICTARPHDAAIYVKEFCDMYNLPVEEIITTDNWPKAPYLIDAGAIKHYDDYEKNGKALKEAGIEFVLVDPTKRTWKLMEGEIPLKNYMITFKNDKFYVSDNTVKAFLDRLYKLDPHLKYDPKSEGKGKGYRGIVVRSAALTQPDIAALFPEFTKKYDWLKMEVVATKYM